MHNPARSAIARIGLLAAILLVALTLPVAAGADAPYMGVDTWYGYGANVNESVVLNLTNASVSRGLRAASYRYVWIDTWWDGARDANGNIVVDPSRWPHGMAWIVNYIHAHGFLAGIYTDLGLTACHNGGSIGHYQQDVNQFAAWGFDAVKVDACGAYGLPNWNPEQMFGSFEQAIVHDSPHRIMLLNVGNGDDWQQGPLSVFDDYAWAAKFPEPTSWRTETDLSWPGSVSWAHLLRNIDADAMHPEAAGNGHWNEPDYLAPTDLPRTQAQAQISMWAILAAPMMVSAAIDTVPQSVINMLTNHEVIAISQDRLGIQGRRVARLGQVDVYVKPLAGHQVAVALLNRGDSAAKVTVSTSRLHLKGGVRLTVRDVWIHRTENALRDIRATVGPTSVTLLRVTGFTKSAARPRPADSSYGKRSSGRGAGDDPRKAVGVTGPKDS